MRPIYTVRNGQEATQAAQAVPAMPFGRVLARAVAPLVRPGPLADLYLARGHRSVTEGRAARAVRFEIAERCLREHLVTEIDPSRLRHELVDVVHDGERPVRLSQWFMDGGDWTGALRPLETSEVQKEIDALFDHADSLERSPAFRSLVARGEAGSPAERNRVSLTTPALVRSYFRQYDDLRRSIERDGFRRRAGVPAETARLFAGTAVRNRAAENAEREIGIAIGADGTPVRMTGGRHRTAIAQRLRLPRIPVQVRLVHAAWLDAWVARTGLPLRRALIAGLRDVAS